MRTRIAILATLETKSEETEFLKQSLEYYDCDVDLIDISLSLMGERSDYCSKIELMEKVTKIATASLLELMTRKISGVMGLGGGTGSEICLNVMSQLSWDVPKILVTTLPFDPRPALARNPIVIVPTLVDISGLNHFLRQALLRSAAMMSGMIQCKTESKQLSIAVTALGVTQKSAGYIVDCIKKLNLQSAVIHANGYGGAALIKLIEENYFRGLIDMTVHEITRMHIAGDCAEISKRFCDAENLPRVVLPGGINFLGLGSLETIPGEYLQRPHYQHSKCFTHVSVSKTELEKLTDILATELNRSNSPVEVLLPMGGFSHEDKPGGIIENREFREIVADIFESKAENYSVMRLNSHINEKNTAEKAVSALMKYI